MGMAEKKPVRLSVGVLICHSPASKPEPLQKFADQILKPVTKEIEDTTQAQWEIKVGVPVALEDGTAQQVSDFLDPALTMMTDGKLDLVIVLTDIPISGQDRALVYGSYSKTARVAVMTTRKLLEGSDAELKRDLDDKDVIENGAVLMLHLIGHIIGVAHQFYKDHVMAPFRFTKNRGEFRYGEKVRKRFRKQARRLPDQKVEVAGLLMSFVFHTASAFRNLREVIAPILKGRAFRIPMAMTGMTTAALIPTLVLVFTAEIHDAAFYMSSRVAVAFAFATILFGAIWLGFVQSLYFPRKDKETLTEHAAVVNIVVFFSLIQALIGLFVVVGIFVWVLEQYVFPNALVEKWTALPEATLEMKLRLCVFVSTLATLTAAMAGGLDRRQVIRHFSLFSDRA